MPESNPARAFIIRSQFSNRFATERRIKGYSQRDLATFLCVTQGLIAAYENKRALPKPDGLVEIAAVFQVSVDYLLGLTDTRGPYRDNRERRTK